LLVGRVKRAHGVRGALLIEPQSDAPGAIFVPGRVVSVGAPDGLAVGDTTLTIAEARSAQLGWIITFDSISDRNMAELWRGRTLHIAAADAPAPNDDEVYVHDLMRLTVHAQDGTVIGAVRDVYDAPQGWLLEVATPRGARLVPWREELFSDVDWESGVATLVDLPGLVD
jgi:16S rRNA processing protein RimM